MGFTKEERRMCEEIEEDKALEGEEIIKEEDVRALSGKIASSQYQNGTNIQRLCVLESEDEQIRKELLNKINTSKKHEKENQNLEKELAAKKKFVFRMQCVYEGTYCMNLLSYLCDYSQLLFESHVVMLFKVDF